MGCAEKCDAKMRLAANHCSEVPSSKGKDKNPIRPILVSRKSSIPVYSKVNISEIEKGAIH